jgi:hypothetical protein
MNKASLLLNEVQVAETGKTASVGVVAGSEANSPVADSRITDPTVDAYTELQNSLMAGDYWSAKRQLESCSHSLPALTHDLLALQSALGMAQKCLALARSQRKEVAESVADVRRLSHYVCEPDS